MNYRSDYILASICCNTSSSSRASGMETRERLSPALSGGDSDVPTQDNLRPSIERARLGGASLGNDGAMRGAQSDDTSGDAR